MDFSKKPLDNCGKMCYNVVTIKKGTDKHDEKHDLVVRRRR